MRRGVDRKVAALLQEGVGFHKAGQIERALKAYDKVLSIDRVNPDALNLKGVIANESGDAQQAISLFDRAIDASPSVAVFHFNKGLALSALERIEEALQAYGRAVSLDASHAGSRLNLGLLFHKAGRHHEAVATFRALTQTKPSEPRGWYNLGICLEQLLPQADEGIRGAMSQEAASAFEKAAALDPRNPDIPFAFANLHTFRGDYQKAAACLNAALALKPDWAAAWSNLAAQQEALGDCDVAIKTFDHALKLDPANTGAAVNRGLAYLAQGSLTEGWKGYARRFEDSRFPFARRDWKWPAWQGETLRGKKILLWSDQGIGDEILYSSMIPEVAAQAAECTVECSARLLPLYRRSFPELRIVPNTDQGQAELANEIFDFQSSVLDIGRWLRPDFGAFPSRRPVLIASRETATDLRSRYLLKAPQNRLIGLSWKSTNPALGRQKGLELNGLLNALAAPALTFINLQYGDVAAEIAAASAQTGATVILDPDIDSLADIDAFAAQVAAMDAVVTISNTTAHMAGALGVPTCLYLPGHRKRIWYWFRDGNFSPWYRSLRLYRDPALALNEIATCLGASWVSGAGTP